MAIGGDVRTTNLDPLTGCTPCVCDDYADGGPWHTGEQCEVCALDCGAYGTVDDNCSTCTCDWGMWGSRCENSFVLVVLSFDYEWDEVAHDGELDDDFAASLILLVATFVDEPLERFAIQHAAPLGNDQRLLKSTAGQD